MDSQPHQLQTMVVKVQPLSNIHLLLLLVKPTLSLSSWAKISSTCLLEGRKVLVKVDMMVQNCLTRITYRVSSTAPISIILPKVAAKLGTHPENVLLKMANVGNNAEGDAPRQLPRDRRGLLVDVADNAEDFTNRVIYAALVE